MPENAAPGIPEIRDRRAKVPGLLPKNTQARVLGAIALLMIIIITLAGRQTPPSRPVPPDPSSLAAVDPNHGRIQEYRARIEAETQKLAAEEERLATAKEASISQRSERALEHSSPSGRSDQIQPHLYASAEPMQNWIEAERAKREYQALFASNIALSYRTSGISNDTQVDPATKKKMPSLSAAKERTGPDEPNRMAAKEYRLFEGTVIETVLTNRLDASFSGPVNCLVTTDVYSHDRQHLLIPQGTRILGDVRKVDAFEQQRLAVTFHRLIMPDGFSKTLDDYEGLNQIGETGLRDKVNHHYLQVFGASLALGTIAGLSQANTRYGDTSAADVYRQGVASSLAQSSVHILDRYLNVLPTFTIREGHRIKVYLAGDLTLPAYDAHQVPADL